MKRESKQLLVSLFAGLVFGVGLAVSGMTQPSKVVGFLDPLGRWDASLMFVMAGAIAVHFVAYRLVKRRSSPLLTPTFSLPTRRDLDVKLLAGAALFGVGWGVGGFCPGPGLVSLGTGAPTVLAFVAAMLGGMFATAKLDALFTRRAKARRERAVVRGNAESAV